VQRRTAPPAEAVQTPYLPLLHLLVAAAVLARLEMAHQVVLVVAAVMIVLARVVQELQGKAIEVEMVMRAKFLALVAAPGQEAKMEAKLEAVTTEQTVVWEFRPLLTALQHFALAAVVLALQPKVWVETVAAVMAVMIVSALLLDQQILAVEGAEIEALLPAPQEALVL